MQESEQRRHCFGAEAAAFWLGSESAGEQAAAVAASCRSSCGTARLSPLRLDQGKAEQKWVSALSAMWTGSAQQTRLSGRNMVHS
jgi:hypothetical protein